MDFWLVAETCLLGVMIAMTIIGNLGICWITYDTRNSEPITAMLMMNMALTDFLKAVVDMPFVFMTLVSGDANSWLLGDTACELTAFVSQTLCLASTLSVATVSIDKYCTILYTLDYTTVMTTRRAKLMLVLTWCFAAVISLLPLWGVGLYRFLPATHHCSTDWTDSAVYSVLVLVVGFLLPLSVTSLCNLRIFLAARSQSRRVDVISSRGGDGAAAKPASASGSSGERGRPQRRQNQQQLRWRPPRHRVQAARIILLVFGTFFFCWTTYVAVHVWNIADRGRADPYELGRWWVTAATFVAYVNAVVSPFVYTLWNRRMRKTLRKLLIRLCYPAGRVDYRRSTIVFAANLDRREAIAQRRNLRLRVIVQPSTPANSDFRTSEVAHVGDSFGGCVYFGSTHTTTDATTLSTLSPDAHQRGRGHQGHGRRAVVAEVERHQESPVSVTSPWPGFGGGDASDDERERVVSATSKRRSVAEKKRGALPSPAVDFRRWVCGELAAEGSSVQSTGTPLLSLPLARPTRLSDSCLQRAGSRPPALPWITTDGQLPSVRASAALYPKRSGRPHSTRMSPSLRWRSGQQSGDDCGERKRSLDPRLVGRGFQIIRNDKRTSLLFTVSSGGSLARKREKRHSCPSEPLCRKGLVAAAQDRVCREREAVTSTHTSRQGERCDVRDAHAKPKTAW